MKSTPANAARVRALIATGSASRCRTPSIRGSRNRIPRIGVRSAGGRLVDRPRPRPHLARFPRASRPRPARRFVPSAPSPAMRDVYARGAFSVLCNTKPPRPLAHAAGDALRLPCPLRRHCYFRAIPDESVLRSSTLPALSLVCPLAEMRGIFGKYGCSIKWFLDSVHAPR